MERVAFLVEESGERIPCMLNPESLVVRRLAGLRSRSSGSGILTGTRLADDPILYTGGGVTELSMDLLFDVTLSGAGAEMPRDVRALSSALWQLAENAGPDDRYGSPPLVRFVWGKSWNIPGVIEAVSERLEYFTPTGVPQRSWMRVRLLRVAEPTSWERQTEVHRQLMELLAPPEAVAPELLNVHQVVGGQAPAGAIAGERLDEIAARYYGDPSYWRYLARFNDLQDPLELEAGIELRIPPLAPGEALA